MKAGDKVLDYFIERELGEGGMGKVHLARHSVLDQQVAIKVLDPEVARKPGVRERFIQEANIQARIRHSGIVQVLTATQIEGGTPALVMEYVDGKSLAEVLELRGALPVEDALKVMVQVLSAVGYAHKQGVIHRDLKPSNVMVMAGGEAKVTDFGIAKVLGAANLTRTGTSMGSAHYMSPEQIRRPEAVDVRSDIYSAGCLFYELLTGHPPFGGSAAEGSESDFEIKTAHVGESAVELRTFDKKIPAWLDRLVMQALAKDPGQRPSSCEEMLSQIEAGLRFSEASNIEPSNAENFSKKSFVLRIRALAPWFAIIFSVCLIAVNLNGYFFKELNLTRYLIGKFNSVPENKGAYDSGGNSMQKESALDAIEAHNLSEMVTVEIPDREIRVKQELENKSSIFIKKYFLSWSDSDEKAYAFLDYVLAENIYFYGENKEKKEVLKSKLSFIKKWNSRNYLEREDSVKIQCDVKKMLCNVSGIVDWRAISATKNTLSKGSASFELGIDFSKNSPRVNRELGKVLSRELSEL